MKIPEYAVFDVETKDIGNPYELELSAIAIIFTSDGKPRYFEGDDINEGVEQLRLAKRLAGFNSIRFDVPVLLKYMSRGEGRQLKAKPHWDPLFEMQRQFNGQRAPLRNFAENTVSLEKFELYRTNAADVFQSDPKLLRKYNIWDTYLTYLLLIHAYQFGYINFKLPVLRRLYFTTMNQNLLTTRIEA